MRIVLVEEVPHQMKDACVACGLWDRPGEPAFFVEETNEWICQGFVLGGEDHIRRMFFGQAERHRKAAESYEATANEAVLIDEVSVRRFKRVTARQLVELEASAARARATGAYDDLPF